MSLRNLDGVLKHYYATRDDDVVSDFYKPCLANSKYYFRGVGYFRSSVFKLMTDELVRFCLNDGEMTILTSTDVDPEDHKAALEGYNLSSFYETLESMLDDETIEKPTKLLCAMVATGHLTIKIAVVARGGIYHDKVGYFRDSEESANIVAFHGSGNETYTALRGESGNIETYNVIWDWHNSWKVHGETWKEELDDSIAGRSEKFEVLDFSEIDEDFLKKHQITPDISDYLEEEVTETEEEWTVSLPTLRDYQEEGLRLWRENGRRGILKHATASGKTITALSAIESQIESGGSTIVLVPTLVLMDQWHESIKKYFPNLIVGRIGGSDRDTGLLGLIRRRGSEPMLLISTIRSASRGRVLQAIQKIMSRDNDVLMVVDECHNIGSDGCSQLCGNEPYASLGLSATPERYGDEEGTERVFQFLGPIVHEFSLRDALHRDYLTPYEYHIRTVDLTKEEQGDYDKLRKKIGRFFSMWESAEEPEKSSLKTKMEILIFRARRIVREASGKLDEMSEILKENYSQGQHWLIYLDNKKMLAGAEEKIRHLGISPRVYHSEMDSFNRKKTLDAFEREGGLLLAMKCLDEGVNITCISHGMVLSSTTNPREFIQRRGRMLRRLPGKDIAYIFDAFALPDISAENTGFLLSEILRAKELAEDCENRITAVGTINQLIRQHDVVNAPDLEVEVDTLD